MTGQPDAAAHLAELDARYEAHVQALREREAAARTALHAGLAGLSDAMLADAGPFAAFGTEAQPEAPPPYSAPQPHPYADQALIPDAPIMGAVFDDFPAADAGGIPLRHD